MHIINNILTCNMGNAKIVQIMEQAEIFEIKITIVQKALLMNNQVDCENNSSLLDSKKYM